MKNIIGKHMKEIREQQGLTQDQLAIRLEMAGWQVDRFVISKIERGERQVLDTEVHQIAKALKVKVSSLFGKDE
jgi:transcriptional regulator with XRE-family HTH domain